MTTWALRHVTKSYDDAVVLDDLTLEIAPGETVALAGHNGVGKTTAARLMLGLERPDAGTVERPPGATMAAVFQEDRLIAHLDATANVRIAGADPSAACAALEAVSLRGDDASKPVRELSGGQRRRVAIARALAADAELLVLDEPLTGLDADVRERVLAALIDHAKTRRVLVISHEASDLRAFAARVVTLTA